MDHGDTLILGVLLGIAAVCLGQWLWQRRRGSASLARELGVFFGRDPSSMAIVSRTFAASDLSNLQVGIEGFVERAGGRRRVVGYTTSHGEFHNSLRELMQRTMVLRVAVGPVVQRAADIDVDQQITCVENGLHLVETAQGKLAAHVRRDVMRRGGLELEVLAPTPEAATRFIDGVRDQIARANVYRRKIISLERDQENWGCGGASIRFHRFPGVAREDIVLPAETMSLLERNTVGFFRQAEALRRSGRSLKRGLLLHGKPGTGKTFTAKWLARSLEGVTVILLSAEQLVLIKECCTLARMLAPSLVIMEDVDLIATRRDESRHPLYQISLHQLLNEMDGLDSAAEVIFLLTTNRPEALEPALAARPGRIDQAIEYPLPDPEGRRRLLELYGRGLTLDTKDLGAFVVRTEGCRPAFIQELLRKAALFAAEADSRHEGRLRVSDEHLDAALRELSRAKRRARRRT